MAFEQAFPLFALGPRADLNIAYVHADIGATGAPTVDSAKTCAGFNVTRNSDGNYNLVFPKCKFCLPMGAVRPTTLATEADARQVYVAPDLDATTGTVIFTTGTEADTEIDPTSGSEIVFLILLGF